MMEQKNGYNLADQWWSFTEETCENISPSHTALYFYIVHLNNRLKWKEVFGVPTDRTMNAIGIKSYRYYKRAFDDLVRWGFIKLIEKSHNQYTTNKVALVLKTKASDRAGEKADGIGFALEAKAKQAYINNTNKKTCKQGAKAFIPPSMEEVKQYFDENDMTSEAAANAFYHYSLANWHDTVGKPVLNWKQKMHTNWFKPENRKKVRMLA